MFAQIILPDGSYQQIVIKKLQEGNIQAHNHLYRVVFEPFCGQAIEVLKDPIRASSIVNHAYIKYWLHSDNFPTIDEAVAYLYVMTRNMCLAIYKSETPDDAPNEPLLIEILAEQVRNGTSRPLLLEQLDQEAGGEKAVAKDIFSWRYERNLTTEQIAEEIDSPVEFIKGMENLAKQILHLILSSESFDDSLR